MLLENGCVLVCSWVNIDLAGRRAPLRFVYCRGVHGVGEGKSHVGVLLQSSLNRKRQPERHVAKQDPGGSRRRQQRHGLGAKLAQEHILRVKGALDGSEPWQRLAKPVMRRVECSVLIVAVRP